MEYINKGIVNRVSNFRDKIESKRGAYLSMDGGRVKLGKSIDIYGLKN